MGGRIKRIKGSEGGRGKKVEEIGRKREDRRKGKEKIRIRMRGNEREL